MGKISEYISTHRDTGKVFYKKGSLELSVNAIVILVLAIAMLGVGLLFIRSKFGQIADVIDVEAPEKPGNSQDPIGLSSETIKASRFKDLNLKVNFFNPIGTNYWVPKITCSQMRVQAYEDWDSGAEADASSKKIAVTVIPQKLDGGQNANFQIIIPQGHFKYRASTAPTTGNTFMGKDVCELAFYPCGSTPPTKDSDVGGLKEYNYEGCLQSSLQTSAITKQIIFDVS